MSKTTKTYWNVLAKENINAWEVVENTDGKIKQLTVSIDKETGDYTRLTQFEAGADTSDFGSKFHNYPEEIYVISGRLYDKAFDIWLEAGDYCSRPPGEVHGPFRSKKGCLVLEVSYPSQAN
jgi:quercetin dioxygenase-like cupin family protein